MRKEGEGVEQGGYTDRELVIPPKKKKKKKKKKNKKHKPQNTKNNTPKTKQSEIKHAQKKRGGTDH